MPNEFIEKLLQLLDNFDLKKAEQLSVSIHNAESNGYEVSNREDRYWSQLTSRIQSYYPNQY